MKTLLTNMMYYIALTDFMHVMIYVLPFCFFYKNKSWGKVLNTQD